MRVLVVVHGFPPVSLGGTEIYAFAHARALVRLGDDVVVLTREADPTAPEYRVRREHRDGMAVVWVNNTFRNTRTFEESYQNPAIGAIAAGIIAEFRPDVAHVHHLTCLSTDIVGALAERQVPCIFTLHDYWMICHRGQLLDRNYRLCDGPEPSGCESCLGVSGGAGSAGFLAATAIRGVERHLPAAPARALRRFVGKAASLWPAGEDSASAKRRFDHMRAVLTSVTHFLAPSRYLRDRFIRFGVAPERITTVELGVDHAPFQVVERTASDRLRLGFLGTQMVSKAPHVLLEAFRGLPPGSASVDLFGPYAPYHGDDGYRTQLDALTHQDGVRSHGAVSHDRVVEALKSVDVLVVPSIWPENSPLVIREAFLAGIPVVGSRIGGIPEAVEDGRSGLLFRPGDVDDLRRVLTRFLTEPELLPTLRAGIPRVRTIEDDAVSTRGLYEIHRRVHRDAPRPTRMAAIVLNYGTPDDTWLTTRSLLGSHRRIDEIIVVNNDAADVDRRPLIQSLRPLGPAVTVVHTGRNLGFSGGMNVGIRGALDRGATHLLVVNSDVIVTPDCVGQLERALETVRGAGIAGPVVLSRSNPDQVASLGMSYAPRSGRMRHRGYGDPSGQLDLGQHLVVDAVSGCVMLISRSVFDTVGLFDEDYFFTFEDLDLCLRARTAGFSTVLAGSARVYHEGSRSIGAHSPSRLYYAARNHLLVAARTDASRGRLPRLWRASSIIWLNLAHAATTGGGSLPDRLWAVIRGTRDYLGEKTGEEIISR